MNNPPRIVFMGTPPFARHVLQHLVQNQYLVAGVVSAPDKPSGRGLRLNTCEVAEYARAQRFPLAQPLSLKEPAFLSQLKEWNADLFVVVAFRMLPQEVWQLPRLCTFNLHASLLPQYRGAAPINWALIRGETLTGVTTFVIDHQIDTGHILLQESLPIIPDDTAGSLHDRLMTLGAHLVCRTIDALAAGAIHPKPQPSITPLHAAPKIDKETCRIRWDQQPHQICNLIRGLSPHPTAFGLLQPPASEPLPIKIFQAKPIEETHTHPCGTLLTDHKNYLHVACRNGYVSLLDLQAAGKKRLPVKEFLLGFRTPQALFVSPP